MPRAENVGRLGVYMSYDAIEKLNALAEKKGYKSGGEYVRDLIAKDAEAEGEPIDFGLDTWGRKRKDDEPPPEKKSAKKKTE